MELWAPVITAERDLAAPREVKRFENKARYFAMRLRPPAERRSWLRRRLEPKAPEDPRPRIGEAHIVALTALHHWHPEWFPSARDPEALISNFEVWRQLVGKTAAVVLDSHLKEFPPWPGSEQLGLFFAVVGEYTTHVPIVADAKPSTNEPNHASSPTA
jgi:hypothetical protein